MKFKALASSALLASLSLAPVSPVVSPARADTGDVVAGLIIGGIMGAAINEGSKKKTVTTKKSTKSKSYGISAEQRAANIEVQTALNYFGWNVGSADGVLGNRSKAAIGEYQAFLGHGITGALTEQERTILVTAHARAMAGGSTIAEVVSGSHLGVRGVILHQRDEMTGASSAIGMASASDGYAAPGAVAAAAAAALPMMVAETPAQPAPPVAVPAATPVATPLATPVAEAPALPSFMDPNGAKGALSAECNRVMLSANAAGGYVTVEKMTDANLALSQQFCLTRTAAIATGQELTARVAGASAEQVAAQCQAFGPLMKEQVAALSLRPADEVLALTEAFVLNSGMSPAQLSGTAKVCLGVGYEKDAMDVAIGSALLLTAMGESGYAELLGHHLSQGFGATSRADLASGWYDIALGTLASGGDVFLPGAAGREALVRKAAYTIAGRTMELAPPADVQEAALPSFTVMPEAQEAALALPAAPLAEPAAAPVPTEAGSGAMRAGTEAAMTVARLPFLLLMAK